jgi:hypothetical protein
MTDPETTSGEILLMSRKVFKSVSLVEKELSAENKEKAYVMHIL